MACNVISCKKIGRNTQKNQNRRFYNINSAPELRNDQKSPKKRITQSRFTQLFYRYGIFCMPPDESSHPGGSEYVWQRGVEGVSGQVAGGQSLPYFQKKKKLILGVAK